MNTLYGKYVDQGLEAFIIMIEDQLGNPPTTSACKKYVKDHKLTIPVYFDAKKATKIYGGKETNIFTNEATEIIEKTQGDAISHVEKVIATELSTEP